MFYKDIARIYAQSRPPYPQQLLDLIMEGLPLANRDMYIDLGCGRGELLLPLSLFFEQAIGVDPDTSMLTVVIQEIKRLIHVRSVNVPASR